MREMSQYEQFDALLISYKPSHNENAKIAAMGELGPLIDLTTKTIRLLMDNLKEINPELDDEEILYEIADRIRNAKILNMQTEISQEENNGDKFE
jgi:hypothetical protein